MATSAHANLADEYARYMNFKLGSNPYGLGNVILPPINSTELDLRQNAIETEHDIITLMQRAKQQGRRITDVVVTMQQYQTLLDIIAVPADAKGIKKLYGLKLHIREVQ